MASGEENSERYVQLIQQLINLQTENYELRKRRDNAPIRSLTKKPDRPFIEEDSTYEDWALFVDAWGRYKEMCDLTNLSEQAENRLFPERKQMVISAIRVWNS